MPDCKEYKSLFTEYITGQIAPQLITGMEHHIENCPVCRHELEVMQAMWHTLAQAPEQEPTPAVRDRFYSMLHAEKKKTQTQKKLPLFRAHEFFSMLAGWWPRRPAIQFAVAVMMLLLGLFIGRRSATDPLNNDRLAALQQQLNVIQQANSMLLLQQPGSFERLTGIASSTQVANPDTDLLNTLFTTLNNDANVNVRLAAVDALFLFSSQPGVREKLIDSLAEQTSPLVQIALVDLLAQLKEKQALEALKRFIDTQDLNADVKNYTKEKVQTLL
ncbi:MAG TPA: HEAT repeat domain-containing protein [bacterium]|nr:HEAT repeat domain-containing protein [bacterium]HPN45431.1 HEAT repeat domain-containing protein [bacterium]